MLTLWALLSLVVFVQVLRDEARSGPFFPAFREATGRAIAWPFILAAVLGEGAWSLLTRGWGAFYRTVTRWP